MAKWLFVPILQGKAWNGATIHLSPLGGSEAAVAFLARALQRRGEEVSVVCNGVPIASSYEGVRYFPEAEMSRLIQQEEWDVLVSSRHIEALKWPWRAKARFLWIHDMPMGRVDVAAHRIVALSEFQASAWGVNLNWDAPGQVRGLIIGNGVDMGAIDRIPELPRNENKLVWISNPDRGLALAAKIFQEIRERWPSLELHVYGRAGVYGWGPEAEGPFMPRPHHMENVYLHDPLARPALYRELKTSWAMFYPTYWPETYCIAALEAQGCGLPVIASPFGGLNESVKGGVLSYDFLNAVSQLRNKRRWKKLSDAGVEWARANTWDIRAEEWETAVIALFNEFIAGSADAQPKPVIDEDDVPVEVV